MVPSPETACGTSFMYPCVDNEILLVLLIASSRLCTARTAQHRQAASRATAPPGHRKSPDSLVELMLMQTQMRAKARLECLPQQCTSGVNQSPTASHG